jgi:pterin-4a-carbinolamine dehydratase
MKLAHAFKDPKNHTEVHDPEWEKQFKNVEIRVFTTQLVQVACKK